jgi:hypothetical protein
MAKKSQASSTFEGSKGKVKLKKKCPKANN